MKNSQNFSARNLVKWYTEADEIYPLIKVQRLSNTKIGSCPEACIKKFSTGLILELLL